MCVRISRANFADPARRGPRHPTFIAFIWFNRIREGSLQANMLHVRHDDHLIGFTNSQQQNWDVITGFYSTELDK